jgi:Aconitase X
MQIAVGEFFGAREMVPVASAHLTGDSESMGDAGLAFVEDLVRQGARFVVPTTTNARNVDFDLYRELGQPEEVAAKERRLRDLVVAMGGVALDSCTNYQTICQPLFGEHLAWGDTGTVIYANAVAGARSNFEGGPASYGAALTGRVPVYGMHLPECRSGTHLVEVRDSPRTVSDWGALGVLVGRQLTNYWLVPVFTGLQVAPGSRWSLCSSPGPTPSWSRGRSWPASPSWTSSHPTRWRRSGRGTGSGWIQKPAEWKSSGGVGKAEAVGAEGERCGHAGAGQTGYCGRFGSGQSTWKNFPRGVSTRS